MNLIYAQYYGFKTPTRRCVACGDSTLKGTICFTCVKEMKRKLYKV